MRASSQPATLVVRHSSQCRSAAVHSAPELAALQLGLISTSRPILSVAEESRKPFEELDESCEQRFQSLRTVV